MAAYPANATQTKMQIYSASRAIDRDPITDKSRDWKSNANVSSSSRCCLEKTNKQKNSLSPRAKANPQHGLSTSDAKIYAAKEDDRAEDWDWQTRCLLYWIGVPLPRQPAASGLVFGAAGGVTAEDFVFSTHLGGQLTWCCRLCSPSLLFQTHPIQQRYYQITRSCSSTQQPVPLNYQRIVSFRHSFHNNNFTGAEDVGMVFTYLLGVLSHFCILN